MKKLVVVLALAAGACDGDGGGGGDTEAFIRALPPASITTSSDVIAFAQIASAPSVFGAGAAPVALAQFAGQNGGCPVVAQNGNSVTITGGCTDSSGQTWSGSATSGETAITYDSLSIASTDSCGGTVFNSLTVFEGTMTSTPSGFSADLRYEIDGFDEDTCQAANGTIAWSYSGTTVAGTGETATWSGSGVVGMQGIRIDGSGSVTGQVDGFVEASTDDEVLDDVVCDDEALSGTTTLVSGATTAVVTYDGTTDCDVEGTARWSLDGADQGEIEGINCSVSDVSGGRVSCLALLAIAALLRRRRS